MSICDSGIGSKVISGQVTVRINDSHPLVLLANTLPWQLMFDMILLDLKNSTAKLKWWLGRKIKVRVHLAAFILQQMYDLTDREVEYAIKDNAAYQVFCGHGIVKKWHAPDHTSIEKFRSRLLPETQRQLANMVTQKAAELGIADASQLDIDSTVQEANMTYPTDAKMLRKLGTITANVAKAVIRLFPEIKSDLDVDIKTIALKARDVFFQKKYSTIEEKTSHLQALWDAVSEPVIRVAKVCRDIGREEMLGLKWNAKRALDQLLDHGEDYLESSKRYIETGKNKSGKRLSFHLSEVECFNKGKEHKKYEFGRAFQLGRIGGNFMIVGKCTTTRMDDKKSLKPMLDQHQDLFGKGSLISLGTDKGYYSRKNVNEAIKRSVKKIGIQSPCNVKNKIIELPIEEEEALYNRRAGIEPLIGHAKQGGQLGRSRMKKDDTIKSSGYASVLGFNLRQMTKALKREALDKVA